MESKKQLIGLQIMFKNKVGIANVSKIGGGEMQAIVKTGINVLDFSQISKMPADTDMVLFFTGGQDQNAMLRCLKYIPSNVQVGWWMCDFRTVDYFSQQFTNSVDHIFLPYHNYHNEFQKLSRHGVHYMPQPGNVWDTPKNLRNIKTNCVFIGNVSDNKYHYNRRDILNAISHVTDVTLIRNETNTADQSYIYQNVPISISISSDDIIGGCSNRLYNIIAAGGFAFVKYFNRIEEMFVNHKHCVWFKTVEEIPELLTMYLNDPDKIAYIKSNAIDIFNERYNAVYCLSNIFETMQQK